MPTSLLGFILCAGQLFIVCSGCGGNGSDIDENSFSMAIGHAGGILEGPNGASMNVPAGALTAEITLTISTDPDDLIEPPENADARGKTFAFMKHGQSFELPVSIRIPFDGDDTDVELLTASVDGTWSKIQAAQVSGNWLTAEVSHFSFFLGGVVAPASCLQDGPCQGDLDCCAGKVCEEGGGGTPGRCVDVSNLPDCGNGTCDQTETCETCESDCGPCDEVCGDGACTVSETCVECPGDCNPETCSSDGDCCGGWTCVLPRGVCESTPVCGDGVCDPSETCENCEIDCEACPDVCGDSICTVTETCIECPQDCNPPSCSSNLDCCGGWTCELPRGVCEPAPVCGDTVCDPSETCQTCEIDCGACPDVCGDGECTENETCAECPDDCNPQTCAGDEDCCGGYVCELPRGICLSP